MAIDKQLEILHDHYKETFARIREVEQSRDRLFLWLIGLFALLSLEIAYPATVSGSLGKVTIAGGEFDLHALPLAPLLSATWVLTFAIALRYCQATIFLDRQYPYLHLLEKNISPLIRGAHLQQGAEGYLVQALDEHVYQREGKVYLSKYPLLLDMTWIAYIFIFPLIVIAASSALIIWEWDTLPYPLIHHAFDCVIAGALIIYFLCYRILPWLASRWRRCRKSARSGKRTKKDS